MQCAWGREVTQLARSAAPRHVLPCRHEEADSDAHLWEEPHSRLGLQAAATEPPMPASTVQMQRLPASKPCAGHKASLQLRAE